MRSGISALLLASSLLAAVTSCQKEVDGGGKEQEPGTTPERVFTAVQEVVKSTLDETLTPHWAAGDAIGITGPGDNNVECPLVSATDGTFDGSGVTGGGPYHAVYPYSSSNTFSGDVLTAIVPATQTVASGEFVAPGALVAACRSDTRTLSFKNCVSLLQITIPRNDIKSLTITASGEGAYLSGKFTMDLADETLAPTPVSDDPSLSSSVTLTSSGMALDPGTYYIAVLPGNISGVSLTFTNTSEQSVTISKESAATLARNSGVNFGSVLTYDISTPDELLKWAKESAKFTTWDVVNLNADLNMSSLASEYKEAVDFPGEFHGNGHTISGLTVPLFAKLLGSVDHLTLHSDIVHQGKTTTAMSGNKYSVGMLAHVCSNATRADAAITNVTTEGSITVRVSGSLTQYYTVGGLAGSSNGVPLESCINRADITVKSLSLTGAASQIHAGGIVGQMQNAAVTLDKCINHGDITVGSGCSTQAQCIVGGIAGYVISNDTFSDCENFGRITNSAAAATAFFTAGIAGTLGTASAAWADGTVQGCSNHGVILDDSSCTTPVNHSVAGIVAFANVEGRVFDGCTNDAAIRLVSPLSADAAVGGLFGDLHLSAPSDIKNCENTASGTVTVNTASNNFIHCGGIAAYSHENALRMLDCTNRAAITNAGTAANRLRIGGLFGWVKAGGSIGVLDGETPLYPCFNFGRVSSLSNQTALSVIGGLVGQGTNVGFGVYGSHNRGEISFYSPSTVAALYAGGIAGYLGTTPSAVIGCTTNSTIGIDATCTTKETAAILGHGPTASGGTTIRNCRLSGRVAGTTLTSDNVQDYVCGNKSDKMTISGNILLSDDPYEPPVPPATLTVGTYNILNQNARTDCPNNSWDEARTTIASIIENLSCDIMTLNEMGVPEAQYLKSQLSGSEVILIPNHNGGYSNAPVILFKPARLTLLDSGIYWLWNPDAADVLDTEGFYSYVDPVSGKEYKTSQGRACVWGKFMDNENGNRFYFFSTHPQHRGLDQESSLFNTERSLNSGNIRSLLKQIPYINTGSLPYIVAGDMNTNSSYVSYNLFGDSNLTSAFKEAHDAGVMDATTKTNPATFPGTDPANYKTTEAYRLDHIFHNGFQTRSYTNIFTKYTNSVDGLKYYPSDHLPVKVSLAYE